MAKIQFDFDSIKNRIMTILSSKSEWADFLNYGAIDNVISSLANEMSYEIQYAEYNTMENFWNMARNRSSLLQMSPMHGFIVPRKQGSVGTITISTSETFDSSYPNDIIIPKFFQFSGNDIFVCTTNNSKLNANASSVNINCKQGEVKTVSFLAEGLQYEEKIIYDDSIDNSFFELKVNQNIWTCVDSLFSYNSEDMVYQIRTLADLSGIAIRFGNDVFGKKLSKNDEVIFTYISTKGSQGNIYSKDVITTVESQAFDVYNNPVKLYCTNTEFSGGVDYPSLEYIREISPKVYQTGDRASSRDDYYTILKQMSFLSKISVWGAYETLKDEKKDPWDNLNAEKNVIHLALLDTNKYDISEDFLRKNQIVDKLFNLCDPTDLIQFEKANKIPMVFDVEGTIINSSYTTVEVELSIKSALSSHYGYDVMNFGESVYNSDYVRLIDEVQGIDYHETKVILLYEELKFSENNVSTSFKIPECPIRYDSFEIYISKTADPKFQDEELLAKCDENGNIIGEGDYITTNSKVDLINGNGILTIDNSTSINPWNCTFRIKYQYDNINLKNSKRNNLLFYTDAVIKLTYN